MKNQRKYVFFCTIKNIDKYIYTYRSIVEYLKKINCFAIEPWIIDSYPFTEDLLSSKISRITDDSHRQLSNAEFAVCEFTEKSRTVTFQAMLAVEKKVPLLCLVSRKYSNNVPDLIKRNTGSFVEISEYDDIFDLKDKINHFISETEPLKKRFNVMLSTNTLKKLEILSSELELSKADVTRTLIDKEYQRRFGQKD